MPESCAWLLFWDPKLSKKKSFNVGWACKLSPDIYTANIDFLHARCKGENCLVYAGRLFFVRLKFISEIKLLYIGGLPLSTNNIPSIRVIHGSQCGQMYVILYRVIILFRYKIQVNLSIWQINGQGMNCHLAKSWRWFKPVRVIVNGNWQKFFHITRTYVNVLISLILLFIINSLYILGLFSLVVLCPKLHVWYIYLEYALRKDILRIVTKVPMTDVTQNWDQPRIKTTLALTAGGLNSGVPLHLLSAPL